MAEGKAKWKPFPKVKDWKGSASVRPIDLEALKQLYLDGPDYDWAPFCRRHGFNDKVNRDKWKSRGYDFKQWKREWLRAQALNHDEEIAPQVLDLRREVSLKRVQHTHDWIKRSQFMKGLLDAVLTKHGEALQHDQRHAVMIAKREIQPRFSLDAEELSVLATAASRIQEVETRALLIVSNKSDQAVLGVMPTADAPGEAGGDLDPPKFTVTTMGQAGMSAAESARLLADWFDQAPEQAKPVESSVAIDEEEALPDAGDTG